MSKYRKSLEYKMDDVPYWFNLKKAWDKAKIDLIRGKITLRDFLIISFMTFYGRRIGELEILKASDVDIENEIIRFPVLKTKSDAVLNVPLLPIVKSYVVNYVKLLNLKNQERFFDIKVRQIRNVLYDHLWRNLYDGKMITVGGRRVKKTVRPHVFRHSLAQYLLETRRDSKLVSRFLGHRDPTTLDTYAKYTLNDVKGQFEGLGIDGFKEAEEIKKDLKKNKLFYM